MSRPKPNPKRQGGKASAQAPGHAAAPVGATRAAAAPGPAAALDTLEPQIGSAAMPAWLFVVMIALAYWAMLHLDQYGGGFNRSVYGPYQSVAELNALAPKSGAAALAARGESIYATLCAVCHQASGIGSPAQQAPPLVASEWVLGSPNRLIRIPLHGLSGPIEVLGQPWNGTMPPFGGGPLLDVDDNVAAVLTYIRQAWGNKAPAISPEQVAAVRTETAGRTTAWSPAELLALPEEP